MVEGPEITSASYTALIPSPSWLDEALESLQAIVGTDAGNRGMKSLIVSGDFRDACKNFARLSPLKEKAVIILSGFPCNVNEDPPTETDGPSGTIAIAKAAIGFGHSVIIVTDSCNEKVFSTAMIGLPKSSATQIGASLESFPTSAHTPQDEQRLKGLISCCHLLVACERPGTASDGNCYTMRGINMTKLGLISPLISSLVDQRRCKFIAIGDGGNEMGMGKVLDVVRSTIPNGNQIASVVSADYLIAASISNWGAYALAAGAALVHAFDKITVRSMLQRSPRCVDNDSNGTRDFFGKWIEMCSPTDDEETALLERCVAAGCRDGVTGKRELSVDGLPLEHSLQCLREIREQVLQAYERFAKGCYKHIRK